MRWDSALSNSSQGRVFQAHFRDGEGLPNASFNPI